MQTSLGLCDTFLLREGEGLRDEALRERLKVFGVHARSSQGKSSLKALSDSPAV